VTRDPCAAGSDLELVGEPSVSECTFLKGRGALMTRQETSWKASSPDMSEDLLRFEYARDETKETLYVTGELDVSTVTTLERAVARRLDGQGGAFYLDLSALSFMDSSGAHALVRLHHRLTDLGRQLVVDSPTPQVRRVLEILGLDQMIDVRQ
jgi:anti-anti-sigma factor